MRTIANRRHPSFRNRKTACFADVRIFCISDAIRIHELVKSKGKPPAGWCSELNNRNELGSCSRVGSGGPAFLWHGASGPWCRYSRTSSVGGQDGVDAFGMVPHSGQRSGVARIRLNRRRSVIEDSDAHPVFSSAGKITGKPCCRGCGQNAARFRT